MKKKSRHPARRDRMICFFFSGDPSKVGAALADAVKRLVPTRERKKLLKVIAATAANGKKTF